MGSTELNENMGSTELNENGTHERGYSRVVCPHPRKRPKNFRTESFIIKYRHSSNKKLNFFINYLRIFTHGNVII